MDYILFPETSEDMTISADITVTKLDSGTDKQGLAIGQFNAKTGSAMKCDVLHIQKNIVIQHTFSTISGTGNCGSPRLAKKLTQQTDMTGRHIYTDLHKEWQYR